MPWYLYLALKQLFPTGRRLTFFTAISLLGVATGVWLLVIVSGVMGGFGEKYRTMIVDTQGEIQVRGEGTIGEPSELHAVLKEVPGVVASTPFAEGIAMIEHGQKPAFPAIQGIDLTQVENVVPLRKYVTSGSLDDLDDDTVILSAGLAGSLGAWPGSKVQVISPLMLERYKSDEVLLPTELTVVGIFEIGHQQLDSTVAIVTLRRMQDLYGLGHGVHGLNVKLAPGEDVFAAARRINGAFAAQKRPVVAKTWMEANEAFLTALRLEKMLVTLMVGAVVLVAMFLTTALLVVAVVRKTREIGLIGALGGTSGQVAACFCLQGVIVGAVGTILGVAMGFLTLANIDRIFRVLIRSDKNWEDLVAIYQFAQVPAHITPAEVAGISVYAVTMATVAGAIAAWRAARLKPVEAMRSE